MQTAQSHYRFTLFVTGATARSTRAVANIRRFCELEFASNYDLEVVDLYATPQRAQNDQIIAAPTLVRSNPEPRRQMIGDMSDGKRLKERMKV